MKKVLIVVDMQNDFVDGALGSPEAQKIVDGVCEKIRSFDGDIYVTFDTHHENYLETSEGKNLPVAHCIKGTKGWELNDKVKASLAGKNYVFVEKPTFGSVDLPSLISEKSGKDIDIKLLGLCTDICVVSNALLLKANFPETPISVIADCCAGVTVESHNAALTTMKFCQIAIV